MSDMFKLLLVEDSKAMHSLIKVVVRKFAEVTCTETGQEGVDAFRDKGPFDAILLDLELPDIHGFDVAKKIRQFPAGKRLPIIVISSLDDDITRDAADEMAVSAFIGKKQLKDASFETLLQDLINGS